MPPTGRGFNVRAFGRAGLGEDDLELTRRLRRLGEIRIANAAVTTSGRRWQRHGIWRMSALNQTFLLTHFLGPSPDRLYDSRESGIILPAAGTPVQPGRDPRARVRNPAGPMGPAGSIV